MTARLVVRLTGDNVRIGEVLGSDLAHLLLGVERAVGKTAAQIAGRTPGRSGRLPQKIIAATKLRVTAIREGSLVLELAAPDIPSQQPTLDLDDVQLAESAIHKVIDVLEGSETNFPDTTAALSQLAEDLDIGERYEALALTQPGNIPREATLDTTARQRLCLAAQRATRSEEDEILVGVLYEADFESKTARLRDRDGHSVALRFGDDHAQNIKEALREQTRLQGLVTYDEATSVINSVEVAEVESAAQLGLMPGEDDFWNPQSLEALAASQEVAVVTDIESLQINGITGEESRSFLEALGL